MLWLKSGSEQIDSPTCVFKVREHISWPVTFEPNFS